MLKKALVVISLLVLVYSAWILAGFWLPGSDLAFSSLLLILCYLSAFGQGMHIAFSPRFDSLLRRAWLWIGLAQLSLALAEIIWFYQESILMMAAFPSLADVFYLLFYPLTLTGLMLFPFAPLVGRERRMLWLDLGIVMTTIAMILWYFILAAKSWAEVFSLGDLISLAYVLGDFILLAGVMSLVQRDIEKVAQGTLSLLALSLVFTAVADMLFTYADKGQLPQAVSYLNLLWLVAAVLQVWAAGWQILVEWDVWRSSIPKFAYLYSNQMLREVLPYGAVATSVGVLVMAFFQGATIDARVSGVLLGTLLLFGLVLARQHLLLRENMALYNEMKHLAGTDSLTGLHNRHFFNEVFPIEIQHAERYQTPLCVLMVDVNSFKAINDTYGHLKGDEVLKAVSRQILDHLRAADMTARFGGDEFVIILPATPESGARVVADRLVDAFDGKIFAGLPVRVSVGIASFRPGMTPEQLLDEADKELYRQKGIFKHNKLTL